MVPDPLNPPTNGYGAIDAIMSASMTLLAAESLGLKTAFFVCVKDKDLALLELTENPDEYIVGAVTIANENLGSQYDTSLTEYVYQEDTAKIFLNKHHGIKAGPEIKQI